MTGAGEIRGKSTAITTELDKILTMYDKLTWKGKSHDDIRNKIEAFVSEAKSVISSKMRILAQFAEQYESFRRESEVTQGIRNTRCQHCPTHNPSSYTNDGCHYTIAVDYDHDGNVDYYLNNGHCGPYTTAKATIASNVRSMTETEKSASQTKQSFPTSSVQEGSGTDPATIDYAIVEGDGGAGAELFELDTSIAATAEAALTAIKTNLTTYKGDVSGFDMTNSDTTVDVDPHTGCEQHVGLWTLEMKKEKETVVTDLQTTIDRVENIIKAINCVVDEHTKLQDALESKRVNLMEEYGLPTTDFDSSDDGTCAGNQGPNNGMDNTGIGGNSGAMNDSDASSFEFNGDPAEAEEVYEALQDALPELNTAAICGILANMARESSFVPTAYNANDNGGPSYGLVQWHNERYYNLQNWCKSNGLDYKTVEGQCKFLAYELHSNQLYMPETLKALKSAEDSADGAAKAANDFFNLFERGYGDAGGSTARKFYDYFTGKTSEV